MNFAQRLENFGERTALILEDHSTISYAELARRADAVFANAPAVATALSPWGRTVFSPRLVVGNCVVPDISLADAPPVGPAVVGAAGPTRNGADC